MSDFGVDDSEMHGGDELDEPAIEALLTGQAPGEESSVAAFLERLGAVYLSGPTPRVGPELASVFAVGLPLTEKGDLPVTAASKAHGPELQVSGLPKWRRTRTMLGTLLGTLVGKMAAAGVAAAATVGSLGAAGVLPDPLQSVLSDTAGIVGVHFPSPNHEANHAEADGIGVEDEADEVGDAVLEEESDGLDESDDADENESDDADENESDDADDGDELDSDDIARCGEEWDGDSSGQGHCGDGTEEIDAGDGVELDDDGVESNEDTDDDASEDSSGSSSSED